MVVNMQPISLQDTETLGSALRSQVDDECYLQTMTSMVWLALRGGDALI